MSKRSIGIGLIGLGVVAGQVAKVLTENAADLEEKVGCPFVLKKIKVLPEDLSRPLAGEMPTELFTTSEDDFLTPLILILSSRPSVGKARQRIITGRRWRCFGLLLPGSVTGIGSIELLA